MAKRLMRLRYQTKVDFLQSHDSYPRCTADDQRTAARSCAIGEELPEQAILDEITQPL